MGKGWQWLGKEEAVGVVNVVRSLIINNIGGGQTSQTGVGTLGYWGK